MRFQNEGVVGRFAPSPTGDLHMGSLMAAVASYLQARVCRGRWLLRIEDLDSAREIDGASSRIMADLERFGFEWDGEVVFQSKRHARYAEVLDQLISSGQVYACHCSRREIAARCVLGVDGYRYDGACRDVPLNGLNNVAWRVKVPDEWFFCGDGIQGSYEQNLARDVGDFVLLRADGCWAYQLAVVIDDADMGVNQVVRGADLLDSTPRQNFLQRLLGLPLPDYYHLPVIANEQGEKLSKQTRAPSLLKLAEGAQLWQALQLLHQQPPMALQRADLSDIWAWAKQNWCVHHMPQTRLVSVSVNKNCEYQFLESSK